MNLELIKSIFKINPDIASRISVDAWITDQQMRGEKVRLFREYADGDQRADLTPEMRAMLRIPSSGSLHEFNDNYMGVIIQSSVDRLELTGVDGDDDEPDDEATPEVSEPVQPQTESTPPPVDGQPVLPQQQSRPQSPLPEKKQQSPSTRWASDLLKRNRFDAMQSDIWEAAIRDGDTYIMPYWDNEQKRVRWSHEPAYDGIEGIIAHYASTSDEKPLFAFKIWRISTNSIADTVRINLYTSDRVVKYISRDGSHLETFEAPVNWVTMTGEPLGVPIIHVRNRKATHDSYGRSEIEDAIPLQDGLNRIFYSAVITSELTAFSILVALGFDPPSGLTPGMIIKISKDRPLAPDEKVDFYRIEGSSTADNLEFMRHLVREMGNITNTPRLTLQGMASDASSGEALKQREIGLIGKIRRFQVNAGNAIEDLLTLSARIQTAFGEKPPQSEFFYARWKDPEIRNEGTIIDNALKVVDYVDERTFLEMVAPVYGWDAKKIDIIQEKNAVERNAKMAQMPVIQPFETDMAQSKANEMMGRLNGTAIPVPA